VFDEEKERHTFIIKFMNFSDDRTTWQWKSISASGHSAHAE